MKRLLTMIIGGAMAMSAMALTPREAFINAPGDIIAAVDSMTRLDMLDYYDSGSSVASRNAFGGDARVKLLSHDSITVGTSTSSEVTIAMLPAARDTALLVVKTLALPAPDCSVTVYDRNWAPLPVKAQLPGHNDLALWLTPEGKTRRAEVENIVPFIPAIYSYSNGVLTITNTLGRLLSQDDSKVMKACLKPTIAYRWSGKKWTPVK